MLTLIVGAAALFLAISIPALILVLPSRYERKRPTSPPSLSKLEGHIPEPPSVQIVVLGDIGRSPRMQYHALSFAKHGGIVSVIGYAGSNVHPDLAEHPRVSIIPLASPPSFLQTHNKYLFPFLAALKLLHQTWCLWLALAYHSNPAQWMLVQNPPTAPTLVIAQIVCKLRKTRLVIDWHNFGYSILALKLGDSHPMVKINKSHEATFGRFSSAHFCVSNAMARQLRDDLKIKTPILVLHDRPPSIFQPFQSDMKRYKFLSSLSETSEFVADMKAGRCRLLVSSTSWTPDEDFSILIDALCRYSAMASTTNLCLPRLAVIITGKGPQQQMYLSRIAKLMDQGKLEKVTIQSTWLSLEDYARLLASASLGVCLHTSSSGVDLPMKVVDMFGAGLPVVGWNQYEAWPELVTEGVNGLGFGSTDDLVAHLVDLFGANGEKLCTLRRGARRESERRWDDEWDPVAGNLFGLPCKFQPGISSQSA
ncbi:beta-1,4-mannosyltransferase [Blastomyces dermatitidis ER-3]|uniref:Chitobiosyldiphosphodolichol beta-mannosyltransferase n=1 Tax=Ajellomyces dermatitidis (strain ER-3 / ATCC MYA-2586) TaxID=559297 RepID=A0ABP2ETX2_AJEDR|nr:beta-1,4-mannosyltransferase [Blastomyces dermatitidis ER-3]EEQ87346.1 beta-1,4-mannosyltransferase [Blastomyces dermatitidis ER-3]EQL38371.1 beta-1,4-mannosyltransferase [Blastomyces dermatitidis ATCC 26199]